MVQNTPNNSIQTQQRMERAAYLNMIIQEVKRTTAKKQTRPVVKRLTDIDNPDIDHVAILGYD